MFKPKFRNWIFSMMEFGFIGNNADVFYCNPAILHERLLVFKQKRVGIANNKLYFLLYGFKHR